MLIGAREAEAGADIESKQLLAEELWGGGGGGGGGHRGGDCRNHITLLGQMKVMTKKRGMFAPCIDSRKSMIECIDKSKL